LLAPSFALDFSARINHVIAAGHGSEVGIYVVGILLEAVALSICLLTPRLTFLVILWQGLSIWNVARHVAIGGPASLALDSLACLLLIGYWWGWVRRGAVRPQL